MRCEILSTGDEIRSGAVTDTNSSYISLKIEESGLNVLRHHSVGDDLTELVSVLKEIGKRADFAVVSGGLGPTSDDLTAKAAAIASDKDLKFSDEAFETVEKFFRERGASVSESNRKQAYIPEGSTVIPNKIGTAPGFMCRIRGCRAFFLPGVPFEMKEMVKDFIVPYIKRELDDRSFNKTESLTLFNIPESKAGEALSYLEEKYKNVKIGLRADFPQIQVKLYGKGDEKESVLSDLSGAKDEVIKITGEFLVSKDGRTLEEEVAALLSQRGETVALAESCTGGLIGSTLTDISGSSDFFLFSGVTYSNEAKMKVLGVNESTLIEYGAVSVETVKEMAEGARKTAGATYGIATSGIAGPTGGTDDKPVGTICIGVSTEYETLGFKFVYNYRMRGLNKKLFAAKAMDLLRRKILEAVSK